MTLNGIKRNLNNIILIIIFIVATIHHFKMKNEQKILVGYIEECSEIVNQLKTQNDLLKKEVNFCD